MNPINIKRPFSEDLAETTTTKRVRFSKQENQLSALARVSSEAFTSIPSRPPVRVLSNSKRRRLMLENQIFFEKRLIAETPKPYVSSFIPAAERLHKTISTVYVRSTEDLNFSSALLKELLSSDELTNVKVAPIVINDVMYRSIELHWETKLLGGEQLWMYSGKIQRIIEQCFGVGMESVSPLSVQNSAHLNMTFGSELPTIANARTFSFNPATDTPPVGVFRKPIESLFRKQETK